ncbi:hypothetical protein GVN21_18630 [Caulobacter sp. SLTY]|uniref:hypothetical protein n=1 Tax=Caulobacter sp. SLTY TaxID=2683262 RepID=UPI001412205F|nr:hypothetical protein [Caulobacter sp. SLTY]NBB17383.1 hypothetical protein [Caulobacter sp. SLTY]
MIARRDLIVFLSALSAGAASAAMPVLAAEPSLLTGLDKTAGGRIGQAWLKENPGATAAALTRRLAPKGWSPATLERLRLKVADDFRQGRVFRHRGWRLADTEGALFGLLALTA